MVDTMIRDSVVVSADLLVMVVLDEDESGDYLDFIGHVSWV